MHIAMLAVCLAVFASVPAVASIPASSTGKPLSVKQGTQLADYYKGGKVCRKVGSATVCN